MRACTREYGQLSEPPNKTGGRVWKCWPCAGPLSGQIHDATVKMPTYALPLAAPNQQPASTSRGTTTSQELLYKTERHCTTSVHGRVQRMRSTLNA